MDNGTLTASEVALLNRDNNVNGMDEWIWPFVLLMMFGFNGFGNRGGNMGPAMMGPGYVTQADMTAGLNNQTVQNQLQNIAVETANNNLEVVKAVNGQTTDLLQQNNTNLINAIQGFNQVNLNIAAQGAENRQMFSQMMAQMEQCCCSIKTQMLQDKLADTQFALNTANNNISNANQSQYLLGQLGRFVPYTGTAQTSVAG